MRLGLRARYSLVRGKYRRPAFAHPAAVHGTLAAKRRGSLRGTCSHLLKPVWRQREKMPTSRAAGCTAAQRPDANVSF